MATMRRCGNTVGPSAVTSPRLSRSASALTFGGSGCTVSAAPRGLGLTARSGFSLLLASVQWTCACVVYLPVSDYHACTRRRAP